jgi:hypothetical protein
LPEPEVKRVCVVVVPPVSAKVDDENVVHVKVKYDMKIVALLLEIDVTTDWAVTSATCGKFGSRQTRLMAGSLLR